jgi:hypothetical protein
MGQLRVGHSVYHIEGRRLKTPFSCGKMGFHWQLSLTGWGGMYAQKGSSAI